MTQQLTIWQIDLHKTDVGNIAHFDTNLGNIYYFKGTYTLELPQGNYANVSELSLQYTEILERELRIRIFNNGWEV